MFNLIFKITNAATVEEIIQKTINQVVSPFIGFLIVLATVVFIWGVIEFISGAESGEKRITGKKHMIWGIFGLFIMLSAAGLMWIIVNFWANI